MKYQLKISIIGLGNMGIGIYKRLSDRGYSVYAYDSNKSLLNSIPNDLVTNVDDILLTSDIVFFAVPSNKDILSIIENKKIKKKSLLIDLTTSNPKDTIEINKKLILENVYYYDAAMSGGALGALNGTLTLMIGAQKKDLKVAKNVLNTISSNIFYYGSVGNGHLVKLLHNSVCHGIFLMMCEVGNLGEESGISIKELINTFNCSNARSYISEERFPNHIISGKYDGQSLIKNLQKDLNMVKEFSNTMNTTNNYISMTDNLLSNFDKSLSNNDFTEIYKLWNQNISK